jgi:amino acid adenylation domain-containing protein
MEGSIQYHVPVVLKLQGKLDIEALGAAMQQIVERHEVLRTVFQQQDGEAFQVIQENVAPVMQVVEASRFTQDVTGLENYIKQLIRAPFNLSEDCMLRAHLMVLGEEEYILVATLHHIASDGWSRSILVGELAELYALANEKRPSSLKLLPVQYADFALWQRNYLSVEVLEKKLAYWKDKLSGVLPLDLPTDHVRPAVQGTRGAVISFQVDSKLAASLQHLSQKHGATLYMTLLSAFNVLLARYSSQEDICVGTPIAGRQQQELEGLIGFFVNTLAMRSQVDQDASFTALLQQVKTTTMEGYANQEIPFEKVVEAVVKDRDLSRNPLFQVMFILRNTPDVPELRLGDIALSRTGYEHSTSLFDFSLFITETENGLHGAIEYSTDLYTRATIERMAGHFTRLLGAIVARPEEKTGQLALLTAQEEQTLLSTFNATAVPYPGDKSVADLFEEQAQKTPLAKAIVFEGEELSYQELDKRSNQLAHYLRGKGVREGMLVPICIERSIGMVVGVLGILKAGAAYVPVDPEFPSDRIAYMLADSAAGLVVTSSQSRSKPGQAAGVELVELDTSWPCISTQSTGKVDKMLQPDHLVYVMYTSGSTGKPKGVRMGGRGMVNLLSWQQKQFVNKNRHVLQFASLTFDVSFQEIFSTLCFGSTLYLINEQRRKDMSAMLQDIRAYSITHLFVPYIVLKSLVEHISTLPGDVVMPQQIIVAGEQLKLTEDIRELIKQKGVTLVNQYGPTEAHVVSSYTIDPSSSPALPPIGKPIDNTQLYVTNPAGGLCPVGVAGELCIGGVQVAQGYLSREALTAEKFIEDRFSKREGARLYRTGDVARWLQDGNLEYLGRIDEQVKVRGYRIELGEIESAVQQSGLVSQGVVMAPNDSNGHKRLVGYIVAAEKFDKQALTSYLHTQLPDYMVPSIWVEMQSLPITPNGKIDKRALPDPDVNELSSHSYVAPRTETEKKLAEIWQQLLGVEKVGIHDNFFELGGHSLMVMRVVAYVERELSISIPIHLLFQLTSINELGKYIEIQNFDISKEKNTKSFKVLDV